MRSIFTTDDLRLIFLAHSHSISFGSTDKSLHTSISSRASTFVAYAGKRRCRSFPTDPDRVGAGGERISAQVLWRTARPEDARCLHEDAKSFGDEECVHKCSTMMSMWCSPKSRKSGIPVFTSLQLRNVVCGVGKMLASSTQQGQPAVASRLGICQTGKVGRSQFCSPDCRARVVGAATT